MMNSKIFKRIAIAVALIMMCGSFAFAAAIPPDVAGSAQKDAILALIEAEVITGSTDGLFHPFDNLTRAQACIIIVKAISPPTADVLGTPVQSVPRSGFSDMSGYGWADGYVSYAVRNGIVYGYPDGTFRPGSNVTCAEMLTMVLRAAGCKDSDIGTNWPDDYVAKAIAEGITEGLAELPELATKEIAARMAYNKLKELRAIGAAASEKEPEGSTGGDGGAVSGGVAWNAKDMTYATGKFNANMTEYAGTKISAKAEIYTYGVKASYKRDMKLPEKQSEYRLDTVNKFKLADTPCFYIKTGNEITVMILPMDAGFSGRIYGVINNSAVSTNGKGETVNNIYTLAAGQQVAWLTKDSSVNAPPSADYLNGGIYELTSKDGTITAIAAAGSGHKDFRELTTGAWEKVKDVSDGLIWLENGSAFSSEENAVIYVLNTDGKSYKVGKPGDIRKGAEVRAYTITDEGDVASYITVNKK
jgi:hypothetical protein